MSMMHPCSYRCSCFVFLQLERQNAALQTRLLESQEELANFQEYMKTELLQYQIEIKRLKQALQEANNEVTRLKVRLNGQ